MTLAFSRRATPTGPPARAEDGVHRDTSLEDPLAGTTFSQRLVRAASSVLSKGQSRRSFLTKTAVVGSALAIGPLDFVLRPGTAYGYVCGSCGDGWTAFCCTINGGRNSCPAGSFVAGWWKADNAAYCCGAARYIIDCNASCPTSCRCRCAGASCDGRRTCCNQFRYGQCHQEISCYGPVVCRVATCTPPWQYTAACSSASATDNATVNHGAPCLSTDCGKPKPPPPPPPPPPAIAREYAALGGSSGLLGAVVQAPKQATDHRGWYAVYRNGRIYWTPTTGAHEVHGSILGSFLGNGQMYGALGYPTTDTRTSADRRSRYTTFEQGRIYRRNELTVEIHGAIFLKHESLGGVRGDLGYPTSNTLIAADKRSHYTNFEHGRIYLRNGGTVEIHGAIFTRHQLLGGVSGALGYPTSDTRTSADKRSHYANFEHGRIYVRDGVAREIHGAILLKHESLGGVRGFLGYPETDVGSVGDGRGHAIRFEGGYIYDSSKTGTHEVHGAIYDRYHANGGPKGYLGYLVSDVRTISDRRGRYSEFEQGRIYWTSTTGAHEVHGVVLTKLFHQGDVTGRLGYPTSELVPVGALRRQTFEHGSLTYDPATGVVTLG
jgi:uncharacterized protein with LGFP repeats